MTSEYNAAQRLLHKIKENVSEFELGSSGQDTSVTEGAIAQDIQTLGRNVGEYRMLGRQEGNERKRKMMLDRASAMAEDHELLKRRYEKIKKDKASRTLYSQQREELLYRGPPGQQQQQQQALSTAIEMEDESVFWSRSEQAVDGFIAQGMASLDNLREQRGMLQGAHRRILNADDVLGMSRSVITYINRRTTQDKAILVVGMLLTCVGIYFILKYFG